MVRRATRVVLLLGLATLSLSACVVDPYPVYPEASYAYPAYPGPYYAAPAPVYRPCCASSFSFYYSDHDRYRHSWRHDRRHWR